MNEPTHTGAVVVAKTKWNTHGAVTWREWVRIPKHEFAPWVSTDDLGNIICFGWKALTVHHEVTWHNEVRL